MGSKIITAFLLAVIGSAWMLQQDAEKYEAFDSVPREFCGEYVKIFTDEPGDISPGELGVEFFSIEENQVGILGRDRERRYYDVQQVHRLSDRCDSPRLSDSVGRLTYAARTGAYSASN